LDAKNPKMKGNTTYIKFENTDNLKENPEGLLAIFKKYDSNLEVDSNKLKQIKEKTIEKTYTLVFNMNVKNEEEFEIIRKDMAIELQKLGYKVNQNFLKYTI